MGYVMRLVCKYIHKYIMGFNGTVLLWVTCVGQIVFYVEF